MKIWFLKTHRWVALIFALPLIFVLGTGFILSFEPWLTDRSIAPGSLTTGKIEALLNQYDPAGKARALAYRSYDHTLTISSGRRGGTVVDVDSGRTLAGPSAMANILVTARRLHETLMLDARWLVIGSTLAMLLLATLGVLMGLPRISNSLSGWHKAIAWGLLPLIVLSPLTALLMSLGITFAAPPPAAAPAAGAPMSLAEAVRVVGAQHDLSTLVWIRPQGNRLLARVVDHGEYAVYAVTPDGTVAMPRNWPRLWHEGDFAGLWSSLLNVITASAMIGLLVTGAWAWSRRQLKRRARRQQQPRAAREGSPAAGLATPAAQG